MTSRRLRLTPSTGALAILAAGVLTTGASLAQAPTASQGFVSLQNEASDGRTAKSTTYVLDGGFGVGATARRAASTTYQLTGGFSATLDTPAPGKPWLTAVTPRATLLRNQAAVTLAGTGLDLGTFPTVRVGGVTAQVTGRSRDALTVTLPLLPEPGWLPVAIENNLGTTLLPRGIAVLPLIETSRAAASDVAFDLLFRGTQGDQVLWALGVGQGPALPVPGAHFGFALTPPNFIVLGGLGITSADGTFRIPFQGTTYPTGQITAQALFLSNNAGYAPGSFSNVLRL